MASRAILPSTKELSDADRQCAVNKRFPAALVRRLHHGEMLFSEGALPRYCYEIISGVVKEYRTLEDGQREITDFYSDGSFVGVDARGEYTPTIEAVTDCVVRCIPREALFRDAQTTAEISMFLIDLLAERLDRARQRTMKICRKNANQRLAGFLLELAKRQGRTSDVRLPMSRQDIGDHMGLTIETVCRALTEIKKTGVVTMPSARTFTILDEQALAQAAGDERKLH